MPKRKEIGVLPRIEVYARLVSGLEWICPDCGKMNTYTKIKYRKPRVVCKNNACDHVFLIGCIVGEQEAVGVPPWNSVAVSNRAKPGKILNRRVPPDGEKMWARPRGGVFWLCDQCGAWAYDFPDWKTGKICCKTCRRERGTGLIFYHAPTGSQIGGSPWDWTPPRGFYVPMDEGRAAPAEVGVGDGAPSGCDRIAGEAGEAADGDSR